MAENGGPIASLTTSVFPIEGKTLYQSIARLRRDLRIDQELRLYSNADGTGAHSSAAISRFIAVSESLERWALYATANSEAAPLYAFDLDPTSNGLAAYPGLFSRQARARALLEAAERFAVFAWWEGKLEGKLMQTPWPHVKAILIQSPLKTFTCIAFRSVEEKYFAYGHAASKSAAVACERAMLEMSRNRFVIELWMNGPREAPTNLFERRAVFFSSPDGHVEFRRRMEVSATTDSVEFDCVCDREVRGPWSNYATVWRVAFRPISSEFLENNDKYFFW